MQNLYMPVFECISNELATAAYVVSHDRNYTIMIRIILYVILLVCVKYPD